MAPRRLRFIDEAYGFSPREDSPFVANLGRAYANQQSVIHGGTKMRGRDKKRRQESQGRAVSLGVVRTQVAGIDIGSSEHWVCGPQREDNTVNVRKFGTTTPQLEELAKWLKKQSVDSVAMESTGVYWIPLYEVLESKGFEVLLVNAQHLKNVPGRKTDVKDCQWIQLLHSHGLLRGSFRPNESICALRALQRQCKNLVEERSQAVQWMQKALDHMNIQVHRAVSDLTGVTGIAIVRAIVDGERDPHQLAQYRDHRCRKTVEEIAEHLTGTWREEHLFNLERSLLLYDHLQEQITTYETRIREEIENLQPPDRKDTPVPPHPNKKKEKKIHQKGDQAIREALYRFSGVDLFLIDGINAVTAEVALTEVGPDLHTFPTEDHFVSWLHLVPYAPISGGKRLKKKKKKGMGATRLASALRMSALTLRNSKTALGAEFRRIARTKDAGVAVFALARKLAKFVYRMLRFGQEYVDIGEKAYEQRFQQRRLTSLKASARNMGFQLSPIADEDSA
jgi:transposase